MGVGGIERREGEGVDQTKSTYENAMKTPLPYMLIKNKPGNDLEKSEGGKTKIIHINESSATQG